MLIITIKFITNIKMSYEILKVNCEGKNHEFCPKSKKVRLG